MKEEYFSTIQLKNEGNVIPLFYNVYGLVLIHSQNMKLQIKEADKTETRLSLPKFQKFI